MKQLGSVAGSIRRALLLAALAVLTTSAAAERGVVLFLGDSITAGYGLDLDQAYPALIQDKIDARGWRIKVVNAGQTGDTSAGGLQRLDWLLRNRISVLVLELGGNDGLRGLPVEGTRKNLQTIIDRTKAKYPDVQIVVAGMKVPPNMGREYSQKFAAMYSDLAKKNNAALIPFVLEGVGGVPELNLPDRVHPTAKGQQIVAETVWKTLEPVLRSIFQ